MDYEESPEKKAMMTLAEKSAEKGGKSLKAVASRMEKSDDKEINAKCALAYKVFSEAIEMYKDGDMDFAEMIEDVSRSLKAIEN